MWSCKRFCGLVNDLKRFFRSFKTFFCGLVNVLKRFCGLVNVFCGLVNVFCGLVNDLKRFFYGLFKRSFVVL